ncbi:hypothetical protein D3C76_1051290 [compost metagenome]
MNATTDRELLELAAKAAGAVDTAVVQTGWDGFHHLRVQWEEEGDYVDDWDPLGNDGDALRLAFKLGFSIDLSAMIISLGPVGEYGALEFENLDGSLDEVRRAIVCAAAEVGKALLADPAPKPADPAPAKPKPCCNWPACGCSKMYGDDCVPF